MARRLWAWPAAMVLMLGAAWPVTGQEGARLRSGSAFLSPELRAMEADEAANPGMLWVAEGEALWQRPEGPERRSCASCHGSAEDSMKGVAARYPAIDAGSGALLNLELRINRCRARHQGADPLPYESDALLALTVYVTYQSRGLPMSVRTDGAAGPFADAGQVWFRRRQGQLNLSCRQCHEDHVGQRLRGDTISHGIGVGYPAYRLEWQALGSLYRRLRVCQQGVRAAPFAPGSAEHLSLELYLADRAQGVPIAAPAIRR